MLGETIDQFTEIEIPIIGAIINDLEKTVPFSDLTVSENVSPQTENVEVG